MPRQNPENFAPYASIGSMQLILQRIRKGWVPSGRVNRGEMIKAGISEAIANRTIAALEFLGLINDEGNASQTWRAVATATKNDYPQVLDGILKGAYPWVFEVYPDPANATAEELSAAFTSNQPFQMRARMVSLFRGLCQEAGLIAGEPEPHDRRPPTPRSDGRQAIEKISEQAKPETHTIASVYADNSLKWFNEFGPLMSRLPNHDNPEWTQAEKDRWLTAFQSTLEVLIKTRVES